MKVIGISGLENSMAYKKARWPGLEEREYRIAQGMDAAAALVIDGKLVAAAEQERFSGKKHTGDFPIDAINFCLAEAGLTINDIDEIAHGVVDHDQALVPARGVGGAGGVGHVVAYLVDLVLREAGQIAAHLLEQHVFCEDLIVERG